MRSTRASTVLPPILAPVLSALLASLAACGSPEPRTARAAEPTRAAAPTGNLPAARASATPRVVVDSVLPMSVQLARFRRGLPRPARLTHGATSRDALVRSVVRALATSDTLAFQPLAIDRAEFAWLYFPTTAIAHPPYELPPGLAWFRLQEDDRKGVFRALREISAHHPRYLGYHCDPRPRIEGENRIWTGCRVALARDDAPPSDIRLFSGILERDGRFAVLSYDNDF